MSTDSVISEQGTGLVALTDAQNGVWFAEQVGEHRSAYHLGLLVDLHGDLNVPALERAVASVLARHPVLAAGVQSADGRPSLCLGRHAVGLTRAGADVPPQQLLSQPFALTGAAPLARFVLQALAPDHHRLVIAAHHLVFDGQSKDILLRDLADAYADPDAHAAPAAAADGEAYAEAVRAGIDRGHRQHAAARAYWAEHPVSPAPALFPDLPPGPGPAEGSLDVPVSASSLRIAAQAAGVTTFELLVAATYLLLHRYGNDPVTVTVDVSTRDHGSSGVIGMFVNELPVTVHGPVAGPFAEFATAVRGRLRDMYPLRAVPVSRVAPVRAGAAPAVVSVSYRRQGPAPVFAGLRTVIDWAPFVGAVRGPLHLQIVDCTDQFLIRLRHDTRVLGADTAAAVARHLTHLLDQVVRHPFAPAHRFELMPPAEREHLQAMLSGPAAEPPTTLTQLLTDTAATATAEVVAGGVRVPQARIHAAALRLAGRLADRGIGPGQVVGLCAERGTAALIGLLAIVRTGAAYLPLDPQYPAQRLRFMLQDAAPALVLCTPAGQDLVAAAPTLLLGDAGQDTRNGPAEVVAPRPDGPAEVVAPRPGDPAYVIYTSGSTGRPKGVVVPHRAIVNLLRAMAGQVRCRTGDVWLALTSLSFDISTVECFLPLLTGATVVVATDAETRDGAALLRVIQEQRVTHVQATPSTWELLLAAESPQTRSALAGVTALCGGEPLTPALAERLLPRVARLINVYGPTETTVWSTLAEVTDPHLITVGRPLAGTDAYVVDRHLSRVPAGVTGRLALAGAGVADHYHARAALTAERFVPDPFGPPGSRLYLTGDNAQVRPDGTLRCLGRDDLQVKVRGHRVELGEIEAQLREHPGVTGAVVSVEGDGPGPRLIAHVTAAAELDLALLRTWLGGRLPAAMVPARIVRLDALPMTLNGKVDRNALPAPDPSDAPAEMVAEMTGPPAGGGDVVLAAVTEIWSEALKVPHAGVHDDLFDAGGHSLTVTQIVARIRDRLGVDLPLHLLWDAPTIAQTVDAVRAAMTA